MPRDGDGDGTGAGGLTIAQIAVETGVPEGTVKARLARGRAALVPHLREPAGQGASRGRRNGDGQQVGDV